MRFRDGQDTVTLRLLALPLARLPVFERESTGPLISPCPLADVATSAEHKAPQAKCCHKGGSNSSKQEASCVGRVEPSVAVESCGRMVERGQKDHGIGEWGDGVRRGYLKVRRWKIYSVLKFWTHYRRENPKARLQSDRRRRGQG